MLILDSNTMKWFRAPRLRANKRSCRSHLYDYYYEVVTSEEIQEAKTVHQPGFRTSRFAYRYLKSLRSFAPTSQRAYTYGYINSHSRFRGVHFGLDFTALVLEYNESISGSPALNLILIFLRNRVDFSLEIRYFARWWKIFCNDYSLSAWQRIRFIVACCLLSREKDNKWWWMLSRLLVSEREYAEETTASLGGSKYSASSKNTPHHWLSELYTHPRFFRVFTDSIVAT